MTRQPRWVTPAFRRHSKPYGSSVAGRGWDRTTPHSSLQKTRSWGPFVDADTVLKAIESTAKFPCTYDNRGRFEEWLEGNVAGTGDALVKLRPLLDLKSIEGWPKGKHGSIRLKHEGGLLVAEVLGDFHYGFSGRFKFNERLELQEKEVFFRPFTPLVEDPDFPIIANP